MDYDRNHQDHIDQLQADLFREKLRNVEASKLEEAAQRVAHNKRVTDQTAESPDQHDGKDKLENKTGKFRSEDVFP
jgi:hypothetical protein